MNSPSNTTRRHFLRQAGVVTAAFAGLREWAAGRGDEDRKGRGVRRRGCGWIRSGSSICRRGFPTPPFSRAGDLMDDGLLVPGKHDGMGAFAGPNGMTILVRNHELAPEWADQSAWRKRKPLLKRIPQAKFYDWGKGKTPGLGGTTTVVFDTKAGVVEREWLSLVGTNNNCAGGVMPWKSWITCEEAVQVKEKDVERDHGYNFEVPALATGLVDPAPLVAMGRFRHEAVARGPHRGIIYQTEDRNDGLLYRFIPNEPEKLLAGGKLPGAAPARQTAGGHAELSADRLQGRREAAVEWIDVDNVESPDDDMRYQGFYETAAARFARGEGIWAGADAIYFACTDGGTKRKGQIWRYFPSAAEGTAEEGTQPGQLELFHRTERRRAGRELR
jgi:secreted PhoX family phosphatase